MPSFRSQIIELSSNKKEEGYYWRRKSENVLHLYFKGKPIASCKNTMDCMIKVREHAQKAGLWSEPEVAEHYYRCIDNEWILYVRGRFAKKSKVKKELEDYIEIFSWLQESGRGKSWSGK